MNQAFHNPENPYITLEPGTYWSPYIHTLLRSDIAEFHPEESDMIRLVDFRLTQE